MSFFKHNGIKIHYERCGSGPAMLFINGLGMDKSSLEPLAGRVADSFSVTTYDMRCAGESDKPDERFVISDIADEAIALLNHLKIQRTSVLGFSMGGMIAIDLALRYPERVESLFLIATSASPHKPYPTSPDVMKIFRRTDVCNELLAKVYEIAFGSKYKSKISADDFISFRLKDTNPQPAYAYLRQLDALEEFDATDAVEKITAKTIIVAGAEDKMIPPENSKWLAERVVGSQIHVLEGIGHMVPVEATDELAEIILTQKTN